MGYINPCIETLSVVQPSFDDTFTPEHIATVQDNAEEWETLNIAAKTESLIPARFRERNNEKFCIFDEWADHDPYLSTESFKREGRVRNRKKSDRHRKVTFGNGEF